MTLEEEGAYRRAIDYCWLNGTLPNDPEKLAKVIGKGCSIEVATCVQEMFIIDKKNSQILLHERLQIERKKQKINRQKKSKAGKVSAENRRKAKEQKELDEQKKVNTCSTDVPTGVPTQDPTQFNSSSSSSSSSSSADLKEFLSADADHKNGFEKKATNGAGPPDAIFVALVELCGFDLADLTEKNRGSLAAVSGHFRKKYAGKPEPAIVAGLQGFAIWWRQEDWRGKRGQVPTPTLVQENWKRYGTWHKARNKSKAS